MAYSIAETAKKFNISPHTLRFYEKEGLLPFVERTATGIRSFSENDLEALRVIMCLKNTGMQIKDIKHFIDLCTQGEKTFEKRLEFMRNQKKNVEIQMTEMQKHYDTILYKEQFYIDAIKERDSKSKK